MQNNAIWSSTVTAYLWAWLEHANCTDRSLGHSQRAIVDDFAVLLAGMSEKQLKDKVFAASAFIIHVII